MSRARYLPSAVLEHEILLGLPRLGRGDGHGGAEKGVVVRKDRCKFQPLLGAHEFEAFERNGVHRHPGLHQANHMKVHLVAPLSQVLTEERGEVDPPMDDPCVIDGAAPSQFNIHHISPEIAQRFRRLPRIGLDLGIHRVVPKVDAQGQLEAPDVGGWRDGDVDRGF